MTTANTTSTQAALATLEKHKKRVEQLSSRQTRIQVQLETAREQYAKAVEQAQASYGTANLDELRALLTQKVQENNQAVADFVQALDECEAHIVRIETALADPIALEALLMTLPEPKAVEPAAVAEPAPAPTQDVAFDEEDI